MRTLLSILLLVTLFSCSSEGERIKPERVDIIESVYASATIQPDSLYEVFAAVNGILDDIFVNEGDEVLKGEPIFKIVNTQPVLNVENAALVLEQAKYNYSGSAAILKTMEEEITAAKLKLANDSISFYRQKNLWKNNIGSQAELDARKLAYELSRNNLNRLETNFTRTKQELEMQLNQAANQYRSSQTASGEFIVSSKINGTVYSILKNPGEKVSGVQPVATVGSSDKYIIELLVDEVDVVKIKKDQQLLLTLDAYQGVIFEAAVSRILPQKDIRNQTFTIEAMFNEPPEVLYPGLSGEANIIINRRKNVLTLPKQYLIEGDKVKTPDGIKQIITGSADLERVEIISGISEDAWILKPDD